jgi:hypothetical protein
LIFEKHFPSVEFECFKECMYVLHLLLELICVLLKYGSVNLEGYLLSDILARYQSLFLDLR